MPLPFSTLSRLSDHFGQYTIFVTCLSCGHTSERSPADLAKRFGWNTPNAWIEAHLTCKTCRAKHCKAEIAFDEKPRGWVKNP